MSRHQATKSALWRRKVGCCLPTKFPHDCPKAGNTHPLNSPENPWQKIYQVYNDKPNIFVKQHPFKFVTRNSRNKRTIFLHYPKPHPPLYTSTLESLDNTHTHKTPWNNNTPKIHKKKKNNNPKSPESKKNHPSLKLESELPENTNTPQ